jgi:hypothetical protein
MVVTTSDDGSLRIWDAASGRPLGQRLESETLEFADFSPDGQRLVAVRRDTTYVWDIPFPPRTPSWFADWAESVGGRRLAATGALEPTNRVPAIPASVSQSDFYGQVARWFGAAAHRRTVSPFSSRLIRDWVRDPIGDGRGFEAYAAFPADPLAVVAEAERSLRNEPGSSLAGFYAHYAFTRATVNAEDEDDAIIRPRQGEICFRAARVWLVSAERAGTQADRDSARAKASAAAQAAVRLDPSRGEYRALVEEIIRTDAIAGTSG